MGGPKAILLVALQLGLKVRPSWRRKYGLEDATLESLNEEMEQEAMENERKENGGT